jgi:hypothetical protein
MINGAIGSIVDRDHLLIMDARQPATTTVLVEIG